MQKVSILTICKNLFTYVAMQISYILYSYEPTSWYFDNFYYIMKCINNWKRSEFAYLKHNSVIQFHTLKLYLKSLIQFLSENDINKNTLFGVSLSMNT